MSDFKVGDRVIVISPDKYMSSDIGSWGYVTEIFEFPACNVMFVFSTLYGSKYTYGVKNCRLELFPETKLEKALK